MGYGLASPLSYLQFARLKAHLLELRATDPDAKTLRIRYFTNVSGQFRTGWDWEMVPVAGIEPATY